MVQQVVDYCYRCTKKLESIDDLSIEHKDPWLDSKDPIKMFFDLNNISFSHLSCNSKDTRHPHKIIPPDGMAWCRKCKQFKPLDDFKPRKVHDNNEVCKDCGAEKMRNLRKKWNGRYAL